MRSLKESTRAFFADSSPKGRMVCMLTMVALGCALVTAAVLVFWGVCAPVVTTRPVCFAMATKPPWPFITSLAAAPAVIVTWWWHTVHKDAEITQTRREEHEKRFMEAVKLLASERADAQFGAIYSLEALARESPEDVRRVADTLCAFLRTHGKSESLPTYLGDSQHPRRTIPLPEVQSAFSVVSKLVVTEHVLDLRNARLGGIELKDGFCSPVDLSGAQLFGARFFGTRLLGAKLAFANLDGAILNQARLEGCDLEGSTLASASLEGACLEGARLEHANLAGANLDGACLLWANLEGARLAGASLVGTRLIGANLASARLAVANLEGANLEGAHLEGSSFSGASYNAESVFPKGFEPESVGMVLAASLAQNQRPFVSQVTSAPALNRGKAS